MPKHPPRLSATRTPPREAGAPLPAADAPAPPRLGQVTLPLRSRDAFSPRKDRLPLGRQLALTAVARRPA